MLTKHNKKRLKLILKNALLISIIVSVILVGIFLIWASTIKTPDLSSFDDRLLGQSAKIYDRTGNIMLYDLSEKVRRTVTPFDQISPYAKKTTIAIEDVDFYNHGGIKVSSIIRAIFANIFTLKFSQGGSTITQQVVKNSLLSQDKNITRKIKEWILAIKLERTASKDTILNMYLNEAPYGGNIYGIEEASSLFFNKKSSELTLAESAYLAALPQSPSVLSPYGKNKTKLEARKKLVLDKALGAKMITQEEYNTAIAEKVVFQPKSMAGIKAPHFVMYVKDYLLEKYGEETLAKGGLKIITTLDYELQQKSEDLIYNYVTKNGPAFKAKNAASVAVDPRTGQILMMVGSKDYFDKENEGNFNVTTAHRQPGSSFKPFAYATAFMKGYTPDTPLFDVQTEFNVNCAPLTNEKDKEKPGCYTPQNYEGGFKGLMNFRSALAQSRNIPSVKVLYLAGVEDTIKTATAMGVNDLGPASQYGLTLVLGGGEVSPLDMTSAYGVFANNGQKVPLISVLKIETDKGQILEQAPEKVSSKQVITEQSAKLINDVLSDKKARSSIFAPSTFGERAVALKTGTTNNSRDAWEIGYTPSIVIGAWMGNNDNTPMVQQSSARIVGPLWKSLMEFQLTRIPVENFDAPESSEKGIKPFLTGAWMGPGNEVHSELYWVDKKDPAGRIPGLSSSDDQFRNWEFGVLNWSQGSQAAGLIQSTLVSGGIDSSGQNNNQFKITQPSNFSIINKKQKQPIIVSGLKSNTVSVEYYVNDVSIGKSIESPFTFSYTPAETPSSDFEDELKAVERDSNGNQREATAVYSIQ
jgi:penicillin-binding protein 1C